MKSWKYLILGTTKLQASSATDRREEPALRNISAEFWASVNVMLDQLVAWSGALKTLR
ncbi:hypothetical protein J2Z45_001562 [Cohnella lubricantis]|nr:hypothetical protein [Cohnella lubricantis]